MTDSQMDGGQSQGTSPDANQGASNGSGVQQPSFDAAKLQDTLDALNKGFQTLEARVNGLQSVKDKDKKELSDLKGKIAEYEQLKERFGADGAVEQLELRQTLSEMRDQLSKLASPASAQSPGTGTSGAVDPAQVISEYLDPKDPEVALLVNGRYASEADVRAAVLDHLKAKRTAPSPTGAQEPAATGGAPHATDAAGLKTNYIKEMTAARGNKSLMKGLQNKYRELGVDVGSIDFRV